MDCEVISDFIVGWLQTKIKETRQQGFVVGISGGIDSAVTSALCAKTGFPVLVLSIPILQASDQYNRAGEQIKWLNKNFKNISSHMLDFTEVYKKLKKTLPIEAKSELALANNRSRLRMVALYSFANSKSYLVCGTGNKVEDYAIGFFTKYGDGAVDLSPIGDLVKSEVYELASYLDLPESIQKALPTDGLWGDDLTDEEQIGASYDEIEWAMNFCLTNNISNENEILTANFSSRQIKVLKIYLSRHNSTRHKMMMPPICELNSIK